MIILGQTATQTQKGLQPIPVTATMNSNQNDNYITVTWGNPTTQAQFWINNTPASAQCTENGCTLARGQNAGQLYFRWFNLGDKKWYYFTCNSDYKGRFQGIPL